MDLSQHENNIEKWFLNQPQDRFPDQFPYVTKYLSAAWDLLEVQKEVNAGADFIDKQTLTRHDDTHIKRVIDIVSNLLSAKAVEITPYEGFILLLAIQIHDIKNIEGREDHERKVMEVVTELNLAKDLKDSVTIKMIAQIANCHAGSLIIEDKEEKDKITKLLPPDYRTGKFRVRPRFLAALLRIADEYADEPNRAYKYLASKGLISKKSEVHHKFAESLHNVHVDADGGSVHFEFYIEPHDALVKFGKYNKKTDGFDEVYLLDEIFKRTVKSHYETVYCMRFLRPKIDITKLIVSISVPDHNSDSPVSDLINYKLVEFGYPNDSKGIYELTGEELKKNGGNWDGEKLCQYVKEHKLV